MHHLVEVFYALDFLDSQVDDFLTILSISEQDQDGATIEIPTHENNLLKLALIEEAAKHINIKQSLSDLQKRSVGIDSHVIQELIQKDDPVVKNLLALNDVCQKKMLRPMGTERQQLADHEALEQHRPIITKALSNLGLIDEVKPKNKHPDALLVLGSSQPDFTQRLCVTVNYLEVEHVQPSALYLLGGQRPLWPIHEPVTVQLVAERVFEQKENNKPLSAIHGQINTDFNARAHSVIDRTNTTQINTFRDSIIQHYQDTYHIKWPTELDMMLKVADYKELKNKGLEVIAVDTQMQPDESGQLTKRPTTKDTILSFKENYAHKISPINGTKISVMAISSQSSISYQSKPIEEVLGTENFKIEVVGKGVDPKNYKIREAFDALARSIYAGLGISLKKLIKT
jgi:hypothetical protein